MKVYKKGSSKFQYLYCLIIFLLSMYAINTWFGTGVWYMALALGMIMPVFLCQSFYDSSWFYCWLSYLIFVVINYISGDVLFVNPKFFIMNIAEMYIALSLIYYIITKKQYLLSYYILLIVLVVVVWTAVATQVIDSLQPGIVRLIQQETQNGTDSSSFRVFYAMGLSDYSLPHAAPVLIPLGVMCLKDSNLNVLIRLTGAILLYCLLALVFFSGATGPMMVAIIVTIMSLIVNPKGVRANITRLIIVIVIAMPFLMNDDLMLSLLDYLSDLVGTDSYFHSKIVNFQDSILMGEGQGDVAQRGDLYTKSLSAFVNNFLLGAQNGMGGHSVILDHLASLGIIGFLPFGLLLYYPFKFTFKYISSKNRMYYLIGVFGALFMLITKGISLWYMWFFMYAVLPMGVIVFDKGLDVVRKNR